MLNYGKFTLITKFGKLIIVQHNHMKKIILVFDGTHFSEGAFEFARQLNEINPVLITGIFLPQAEIASLWSYADGVGGPYIPLIESDETDLVQKNVQHFKK